MKKPNKPSEPNHPTPPNQTIAERRYHKLHNDSYVFTDADAYESSVDSVTVNAEIITNIAVEINHFFENNPDVSRVTSDPQVKLSNHDVVLIYTVVIPNPRIVSDTKYYEKMLKSYDFDMNIYKKRLETYEAEMKKFQAWQEEQDLERARRLIEKHEKKKKGTQVTT